MSRMRQTPAISMRALTLLALLTIVHGHVFAQSGSIEVPENARAKEYGNGWECDQGYRAVDGACTVIKLPANAYLTNKLQAEVNSAFRTYMPTRLFSGIFSDVTSLRGSQGAAGRLPKWVFEIFGKWISEFFNCGCRDYPECNHGKIAFGRWIIDRRKDGLNPSGIARLLKDNFELWVYPGDIFSWLDSLIHGLKAVQRIARVAGETDIGIEIDDQIARIERPVEMKKTTESNDSSKN